MRVLVVGATGVIGRRVSRSLADAGHDVDGYGSDLDVFDPAVVGRTVAGHDVVINLATAIPSGARAMLPSAWETTARLRTEGADNLATAAAQVGARFVQESVVTVYDDGADRWLDESAPVRGESVAAPALDAERHALRAEGIALRFGLFYGPDAVHTRDEVSLARRGFAATVGDPDGYHPDVHLDDAAAAVVAAIEAPTGVYNITGDEPLTRRERAAVLASAVGRDRLRLPPRIAGHVGLARIISRSRRVANTRFRETTGWTPRYPSVREGMPIVVEDVRRQR